MNTAVRHQPGPTTPPDAGPSQDRDAPSARLRVAVFVSEFPALSETFVLRQVAGLVERGHDVTVFADRPRDEPLMPPDFERLGLRARTRYLEMPASRIDRLATAARLVLQRGHRHPLAILRALDPFRHGRDAINLRALFWSLRLAGEGGFDVLHCHFGPVGEMVASLREAGAVRGRLVTTFHGADLTTRRYGRAEVYRRLRRGGDLHLPISEYLARRMVELGFPPDRIAVHRMGVDVDLLAERPEAPPRPGPLRVLTIGRLVDKKGVADGLLAVAAARRAGATLDYSIIGDGPLRPELERLAAELGIADIVRFHGWQVHDAVVAAINGHDVLLAPSVTAPDGDQEGIPVTLMEAMATGMPVVSTRHSGIPELVEHEVCGLLAPEGDAAALGEALLHLAASPDLARTMGRAARRRVRERYDAAVLDDRLDGRLRTLAAGRG